MGRLTLLTILLLPAMTLGQRQSAALIIGGYWVSPGNDPILNHVELFGCPNTGVDSVLLGSFPTPNYLGAGVLREEEGRVLACGGYSCPQTPGACTSRAECYWWTAATGNWTAGPQMIAPRFNYLMAEVQNIETPDITAKVPLILGYLRETTEIYETRVDRWIPYMRIRNVSTVTSLACAVDYDGKIYSLTQDVVELDPTTWRVAIIDTIPTNLINPGKCAGLTIGGRPGIFTRYGYWYDLQAKTWVQKASPPTPAIIGTSNALWSFRGKPTIFGNYVCDNVGQCRLTQVVQYDSAADRWDVLGSMLYPRMYHTVIEVPGEYCDYHVTTMTTTTTTTTTTITPATTTTTTTTRTPTTATTTTATTTTTTATGTSTTTTSGGSSASNSFNMFIEFAVFVKFTACTMNLIFRL